VKSYSLESGCDGFPQGSWVVSLTKEASLIVGEEGVFGQGAMIAEMEAEAKESRGGKMSQTARTSVRVTRRRRRR
jgi:hypothetical protein